MNWGRWGSAALVALCLGWSASGCRGREPSLPAPAEPAEPAKPDAPASPDASIHFDTPATPPTSERPGAELRALFETVALAHLGLDYPYTEQGLSECRTRGNMPCLELHREVRRARARLAELPAVTTLPTTLETIESACAASEPASTRPLCRGAIMALFFFDTVEQDHEIRARVAGWEPKTRALLFVDDFAWHHNRPDPGLWTDYVETTDIEWEHPLQRQQVVDAFDTPLELLEETPPLLL